MQGEFLPSQAPTSGPTFIKQKPQLIKACSWCLFSQNSFSCQPHIVQSLVSCNRAVLTLSFAPMTALICVSHSCTHTPAPINSCQLKTLEPLSSWWKEKLFPSFIHELTTGNFAGRGLGDAGSQGGPKLPPASILPLPGLHDDVSGKSSSARASHSSFAVM